jgi:ABC-type uncharacterized transport system auxiliary subunit
MLTFSTTSVWAAYNMVMDARVYQYSNYQAKKAFPVTLRVKVTKDNRPEQEKLKVGEEHPYTYDALWVELVSEMLEKVLAKELSQSGMVKSADPSDVQSSHILLLELNSFHGRWATVPQSFKPLNDIYGNCEFSAQLISRKGDKVLFKKSYTGRTKVQVSQFKNRYAYCAIEAGKAFKEAALQLMADVEIALSGGKVDQY